MDEVPKPKNQENSFLNLYNQGSFTRHEFISRMVESIDRDNFHQIDLLPRDIKKDIRDYVKNAPLTTEQWERLHVLQLGCFGGGNPEKVLRAIKKAENESKQRLRKGVEVYREMTQPECVNCPSS